jgi:uncharacterized membrane protein
MDDFRALMGLVGAAIDGAGVLVVVSGVFLATYRFLFRIREDRYRAYRQDVGRAILLGLEFLVAGDIIRTIVVSPTLQNVAILALIVLIRTFLSFTLELELEGTLPWRRTAGGQPEHPTA